MNDLLGDVRPLAEVDRGNRRPRSTSNPAYNGRGGDVEMGDFAPPPTEQEVSLQGFLATVEDIKKEMAQIKTYQLEIVNMHEKSKTLVKTADVKRSRQEMQEKINVISGVATKVKKRVEALDKENEASKKLKGQGEGSATERTRTTVTAGLKKKLKDQMAEFSSLRNRIQDEYREIVERRVYAVTGKHMPEDEIDNIIESGEAESIFQKAILTDQQGRGRVLDTLAEIEERHRAVKDLEQSLLELHQIFLDMAVLVETQGEMLDNIQKQVEKGAAYVQSGAEALQDAKQLQKKTRKLMCCALMIVLIVALIIVLAVVQPWKFAAQN